MVQLVHGMHLGDLLMPGVTMLTYLSWIWTMGTGVILETGGLDPEQLLIGNHSQRLHQGYRTNSTRVSQSSHT